MFTINERRNLYAVRKHFVDKKDLSFTVLCCVIDSKFRDMNSETEGELSDNADFYGYWESHGNAN